MKREKLGSAACAAIMIIALLFIFARGDAVSVVQYNIASLFAAVCAGACAVFMTGTLVVSGRLPAALGDLKVRGAAGLGLATVVLLVFVLNRPVPTRNIEGFLYEGWPHSQGDPVQGATVHLIAIGGQSASTSTDATGRFMFPSVAATRPKLMFEQGSDRTPHTALAPDHYYYLRRPSPVWRDLHTDRYSVSTAGRAGGDGARTYKIRLDIARSESEAVWDAMDLTIGPLAEARIVGMPGISGTTAFADAERHADRVSWILVVGTRSRVTATVTLRLSRERDLGPLDARGVPVKYRFRRGPRA